MAKLPNNKPINRAAFLSIEKIQNGFIIIEPAGQKTWKATMNGVVKHLEQAFDVAMIKEDDSPKSTTTVAQVLATENIVAQEKPKK